jgi:hypothetical protein
MLCVWIDADNCPIEPALASPDSGIEKYLNPVADFDFLSHIMLLTPIGPKNETDANDDHDATVNGPLRIAGHKTARQNVNPLQEKGAASQEDDHADDS